MLSSEILHRVALIRTNVSEETSVVHSIVTANVVPSLMIFSTLMIEVIHSSETSVFTRVTLPYSVVQSLVTANVVPSLLILSTLMIEVIHPSETSIFTSRTAVHPRRRHSFIAFWFTNADAGYLLSPCR
jgi:hypothetical protein